MDANRRSGPKQTRRRASATRSEQADVSVAVEPPFAKRGRATTVNDRGGSGEQMHWLDREAHLHDLWIVLGLGD